MQRGNFFPKTVLKGIEWGLRRWGAVVKNPPANSGDMGLTPELGRSHMPWSK